jgi:hypothetical protein
MVPSMWNLFKVSPIVKPGELILKLSNSFSSLPIEFKIGKEK